MRSLEEAPFLDPFTEEFQADPVGHIDGVRAQSCLARTPIAVLVVAREQVHRLLSDPRLQSALMHLVRLQGVSEGRLYDLVASALLSLDGADHARIRGLVSRTFTPRAIDPYRPSMRALAEELVERFVAAGECEFMADFADHYPIEVMCQLLGVPPEDHMLFARWGDALTHVLSLELSLHLDEVNDALGGLNDYLDGLIAERQRVPRQDLVSQLVAAGDGGDRLNALEQRSPPRRAPLRRLRHDAQPAGPGHGDVLRAPGPVAPPRRPARAGGGRGRGGHAGRRCHRDHAADRRGGH